MWEVYTEVDQFGASTGTGRPTPSPYGPRFDRRAREPVSHPPQSALKTSAGWTRDPLTAGKRPEGSVPLIGLLADRSEQGQEKSAPHEPENEHHRDYGRSGHSSIFLGGQARRKRRSRGHRLNSTAIPPRSVIGPLFPSTASTMATVSAGARTSSIATRKRIRSGPEVTSTTRYTSVSVSA